MGRVRHGEATLETSLCNCCTSTCSCIERRFPPTHVPRQAPTARAPGCDLGIPPTVAVLSDHRVSEPGASMWKQTLVRLRVRVRAGKTPSAPGCSWEKPLAISSNTLSRGVSSCQAHRVTLRCSGNLWHISDPSCQLSPWTAIPVE